MTNLSRHTPRDWTYRNLCIRVRREEPNCWICGHPIDQNAAPRTPWSFSLDHIVPVSRGGHPHARDNAHAAHLLCNQRRGTGRPTPRTQPLRTSQAW